ncbi:MAG: NAD(P)/FAD-dependent oxidoreductase [Flavobacteriaceae bacterium]|tara:strand:- start:20902 stop:22149 length:1248 start_codon:yes stop_codon:yes gene_type:complete
MLDIAILGGGAAGYYAAIQTALLNPELKIAIIERGALGLDKVKVSGGGRCNVTHDAPDPAHLVTHYPRGEKALLGPFHHHGPKEVIAFFEAQGVPLKVEADGRMFPEANSSQAIVDCFVSLRISLGISLYSKTSVKNILKDKDNSWCLKTADQDIVARQLLIASGSNPKVLGLLEALGHQIEKLVPSLFTFNIKDARISDLAGVSALASVRLILPGQKEKKTLKASGPLLVTHWGMSGPAILKLSAWGARLLEEVQYKFQISINFLPNSNTQQTLEMLYGFKKSNPKKLVLKSYDFDIPKRLWNSLVLAIGVPLQLEWAHMTKEQLVALAEALTNGMYEVNGKSTFKEEFVTAGGIKLKEVSFKDCQSKKHLGLYFAGEVLNIDAITGGFNFQNAWTTAFLAAQGMVAQAKAFEN